MVECGEYDGYIIAKKFPIYKYIQTLCTRDISGRDGDTIDMIEASCCQATQYPW